MPVARADDRAAQPDSQGQGGDRRQRIIDATLEVIAERGVRGTSHRRVAKAAGVPLSTTSYYFGTLESLLEEAFRDAIVRDRALVNTYLEDLSPGTDPVPMLARMLHDQLTRPETAILAYELIVTAMRNERLQKLWRLWADNWHEVLLPLVGDELTASVAVVLTGGILGHGVMSEVPLTIDDIDAMLRRGLGLPQP